MLESPALNLAIVVVWLDEGRETIVFVGPSSVLFDSEFDLDLPPRCALCPSVGSISCCAPAGFAVSACFSVVHPLDLRYVREYVFWDSPAVVGLMMYLPRRSQHHAERLVEVVVDVV